MNSATKAEEFNFINDGTESYCFISDGCNIAYQFGVARYMQKNNIYSNNAVFTGYYSGLLSAIALAGKIPVSLLVNTFIKFNNDNKKENIRFNIFKEDDLSLNEKVLVSLLDANPEAWKYANKRLAIPINTFSGLNLWITEFKSNDDILQGFKASTEGSLFKMKCIKINKINVTIGPLKLLQLLHPLTIIITCRQYLSKNKFVKYVDFDNIELLQPIVSPQTRLSYYIPNCNTGIEKLFYSGLNSAKIYFQNH